MTTKKTVRRSLGLVARFASDDLFKSVRDPRSLRGRRWKSPAALLRVVLTGLMAGCKGLFEVEQMTAEMSRTLRRQLGIERRVPDTTMREHLCRVDVDELCRLLEIVGYDASRRKALHRIPGFPFGVLSMDGKYPAIRDTGDHRFLQVQHDEEGRPKHGLLRTITATLVTAVGRPILGAIPVPKETNEKGAFAAAFGRMLTVYRPHFRLVMYDAGAASRDNAAAVVAQDKDYFFQIADPKWVMYQTIQMLMVDRKVTLRDEQGLSSRRRVVRELTILPVQPERKNVTIWEDARVAFQLRSTTYVDDAIQSTETRYYVSSMDSSELPPAKWLELIVLRWGVETCHQILDTAFQEDDHPWIRQDANGALAVMLLRRIAYTILTLYKHITLRVEENQLIPWKKLMRSLQDALKWPNDIGPQFRPRAYAVPPAFLD